MGSFQRGHNFPISWEPRVLEDECHGQEISHVIHTKRDLMILKKTDLARKQEKQKGWIFLRGEASVTWLNFEPENWSHAGQIVLDNSQTDQVKPRCIKVEKRPNLAKKEDPLKSLEARLILCMWGKKKRILLEWMMPKS